MSLKDTINNTNKQKENTKKVATQIDNKLVELGGERATDLADVVNKIEGMVTGNYKKVAIIEKRVAMNLISTYDGEFEIVIEDLNFDFTPKSFFIFFEAYHSYAWMSNLFMSTDSTYGGDFVIDLVGGYGYNISASDVVYKESSKTMKIKGTGAVYRDSNIAVTKIIAIG